MYRKDSINQSFSFSEVCNWGGFSKGEKSLKAFISKQLNEALVTTAGNRKALKACTSNLF